MVSTGLSLGPVHGGLVVDPRPRLWAEPESLQDPGSKLTLVCQAFGWTRHFQLFRNGEAQAPVHLATPDHEHRFPLGTVTEDTRGIYRCRSGEENLGSWGWTELSELLHVSLPGSLAAPELTAVGDAWVEPGIPSRLVCRAGLRGVSYELQREGDDQAQQTAADSRGQASFLVSRAGNYSCRYRRHQDGAPSPPSASIEVPYLATPPPPKLDIQGEKLAVVPVGREVDLTCRIPSTWVETQLLHEGNVLQVPSWETPGRKTFELGSKAESGSYTCRYRRGSYDKDISNPWSRESKPVELLRSDGSLEAPELSADLSNRPVKITCKAPKSGVHFALFQGQRPSIMKRPQGTEAVFELPRLSVAETDIYFCIYADPLPPFMGSRSSLPLELLASDKLPRPVLSIPSSPVMPGTNAKMHCSGGLPHLKYQLLRTGQSTPVAEAWAQDGDEVDLLLPNVSPQHQGDYSCRYSVKDSFSELSEPVRLRVAGS